MGLKSTSSFLAGFGACLILVACAGASFPYHYYPYDKTHGVLLGATPADDLPDSICEPHPGQAYPCTAMLTDDYFKLKADYLKCQTDLSTCQAGPAPQPGPLPR